MSIDEILLQRRTVHKFASTALPAGALEAALATAVAAPNHRMTEPWRFTVVGRQTRAVLMGIAAAAKGGLEALEPAQRAGLEAKMLAPAELVVVRQVLAEREDVRREDYAAIACAIQNLSLSLWSKGIASKWSTGSVTRDPATYSALRVDSDEELIVGFIWVGFPDDREPPKPKRRKAVADVTVRLP